MYQFISAEVIRRGYAGGWETTDLNYTRMDFIRMSYQVCILELRNTDTQETGYVDFFELPIGAQTSIVLLKDYLEGADNIIFGLIKPEFVKGHNYVKMLFANAFGLDTKSVNRNIAVERPLLPDQQIDLLLYRDDMTKVDYNRIATYGLITIGGLLHWFDTREEGIIIYDGAKSAWLMREARIGILDFTQVASVKKIQIKESMVKYPYENINLNSVIYLNLGTSVIGKTIMISIAGILHPLDNFLTIVDEKTIRVNLKFIDFIGLFYDTYKKIDYSSLPLTRDLYYDDQFLTTEFDNPEVIMAFLKLSQSFVIIIDDHNITVETKKLENTQIPGVYNTPEKEYPDVPIQIGRGYLSGYNIFKRHEFYTVKLPNYLVKRSFLDTTLAREEGTRIVRDIDYGYHPKDYADAHFLYIKKEV